MSRLRATHLGMAFSGIAAAAATPAIANPEVKEHEIARFLLLKTSCVTLHLKRANPGERPLRYHATCKNVSNWPDGVDIECAEHDDDRTCRVTNEERRFNHLELLRPPERWRDK